MYRSGLGGQENDTGSSDRPVSQPKPSLENPVEMTRPALSAEAGP